MNPTATELQPLEAAETLLNLGRHAKALAELERVDPLHRSQPEVLLLKARLYLFDDRPHQARAIICALTQSHPDLPGAWFYLACISARRGNFFDAETSLRKCYDAAGKADELTKWEIQINRTKEFANIWPFNHLQGLTAC